ncbi:MAG: GNAT family N-acetyltransferase [Planctomycetes bacterium]|nr:GNAT family N-acetyltransferase [Planctomycetota bacterium]
MRLRYALILSLSSAAVAAVLVAFDLERRIGDAGASSAGLPEAFAGVGTPYAVVLVAIAVANLASLLLLVTAFREERERAVLRASQTAGAAVRPASEPVLRGEQAPAFVPPPAAPPRTYAWGRLEEWSAASGKPFMELWNRSCVGLYQACPLPERIFEKLLNSDEFDPAGSFAAVDANGKLIGALWSLRQAPFEDEGYWWLESPGVMAALLVDPGLRRKGVGRALVAHAEFAALRQKRPRLFAGGLENFPHLVPGVPDQDHGTRVFYTALGYREVRRTCHMEADYRAYTPPQELIDREAQLREKGYAFAAAKPDDLAEFERFVERSSLTRKARRIERFRGEHDRFYLVRFHADIVGFIQVTPIDDFGHSGIHLIYFLREHRGAGLGSVLLVKAHELWRTMGAKGGSIWTYPEAAERFYRRAGFKTVQEWVVYAKDLPHAWSDPDFVNRYR